MPASAILPLPTTRSSYWRPPGSLCTLPPAVASPAGWPVGTPLTVALVEVEDVEVVFCEASLQPTRSSAAANDDAMASLDMRVSFWVRVGSGSAAQTGTSQGLPQVTACLA